MQPFYLRAKLRPIQNRLERGKLLYNDRAQPARARQAYDLALALLRPLSEEHPYNGDYLQDLAEVEHQLAYLIDDTAVSSEDYAEAKRIYCLSHHRLSIWARYRKLKSGGLYNTRKRCLTFRTMKVFR